jgi:CheY-like chemotaxis protein
MSYYINDQDRKLLDAILTNFEFNERININKCIRSAFSDDDVFLHNLPINLHADNIREFLIRYGFGTRLLDTAIINFKGMALKNAGSLRDFERMTHKEHSFLVIDDDKINNIICRNMLLKYLPGVSVQTFTDPNVGLRHIFDNYATEDTKDVILLLDINMPTLLGWDVLKEFDQFPDNIKRHFKILMFTSSIDPQDRERAKNIPIVWGYIEKPLNEAKVKSLLI